MISTFDCFRSYSEIYRVDTKNRDRWDIQIYVQKNMIYLSCNVEESKLTKDSLFQIKKIDSVGRLYIPLEIRSSLHLMDYGDEVEIYIDNANQIVLKKRCLRCVFCSNNRAGMLSFKELMFAQNVPKN